MKTMNAWVCLTTLTLAASLAGCGGGVQDAPEIQDTPGLLAAASIVSPLLDEDGGLYPSSLPANAAVRPRHAATATPAQAAQLEAALGEGLTRVEISAAAPGWHGVCAALQTVQQHHAARLLGPDAPVLVRGPDLQQAALAADELVAAGFTRVFLVSNF